MGILVRITLFCYNKLKFGFHNRGISGHADNKHGWVVFGYQEKDWFPILSGNIKKDLRWIVLNLHCLANHSPSESVNPNRPEGTLTSL
jgi:hypothetical protein